LATASIDLEELKKNFKKQYSANQEELEEYIEDLTELTA
jgi:hypothetical protein